MYKIFRVTAETTRDREQKIYVHLKTPLTIKKNDLEKRRYEDKQIYQQFFKALGFEYDLKEIVVNYHYENVSEPPADTADDSAGRTPGSTAVGPVH